MKILERKYFTKYTINYQFFKLQRIFKKRKLKLMESLQIKVFNYKKKYYEITIKKYLLLYY